LIKTFLRDIPEMIKAVVLLATLLHLIHGHAVLITPAPWTPNPSKTSPCGAGIPPLRTNQTLTWKIGTVQTINWKLVASDGAGMVMIRFDSTGNQTFPASTQLTLGNATVVGVTYPFSFTVPNIVCPSGYCTIQVFSVSAWFSCATVVINNGAIVPPPVPVLTCITAPLLNFCTMLYGTNITLTLGQTAPGIDQAVAAVYTANLYNPNVFTNGNDSNCATMYKTFLCNENFPSCGAVAACKQLCQTTLQTCGITPGELGLYNCTLGPNCPGAGTATNGVPTATNGVPIATSAGTVVISAGSLLSLGAALFVLMFLLI